MFPVKGSGKGKKRGPPKNPYWDGRHERAARMFAVGSTVRQVADDTGLREARIYQWKRRGDMQARIGQLRDRIDEEFAKVHARELSKAADQFREFAPQAAAYLKGVVLDEAAPVRERVHCALKICEADGALKSDTAKQQVTVVVDKGVREAMDRLGVTERYQGVQDED